MQKHIKHIEFDHCFIQQKHEDNNIKLSFVLILKQYAYIFIKPLRPQYFMKNSEEARLLRIPTSLQIKNN